MQELIGRFSILYVEDDLLLSKKVSTILNEIFHTVCSVHNGVEAIESYKKYFEEENQNYDLILSDINMPFMNGLELSQNIKQITPDQIIIVMSAHNEDHIEDQIKKIGIDYQITKPMALDKLIEVLTDVNKRLTKV